MLIVPYPLWVQRGDSHQPYYEVVVVVVVVVVIVVVGGGVKVI